MDVRNEGNWEEVWSEGIELNFFGQRLFKQMCKSIKKLLNQISLSKNAKILDVGCGTGRTLNFFRKAGFENSLGIDISKSSMKLCNKKGLIEGKDVFIMDGSKTKFDNNEFDLVFSDGLLEHFKNFEPFVKEWCRISNKYIIIAQPNHFSLFTRLQRKLRGFTVFEYTYKISDFEKAFNKYKFGLFDKRNFNFNEQWLLTFKKRV